MTTNLLPTYGEGPRRVPLCWVCHELTTGTAPDDLGAISPDLWKRQSLACLWEGTADLVRRSSHDLLVMLAEVDGLPCAVCDLPAVRECEVVRDEYGDTRRLVLLDALDGFCSDFLTAVRWLDIETDNAGNEYGNLPVGGADVVRVANLAHLAVLARYGVHPSLD